MTSFCFAHGPKAGAELLPSELVADSAFGGGVAFAGVDDPLQFFAFLVGDGERTTVGSDELHSYFAVFAVGGGVGRCVGDAVLMAKELCDFPHDAGEVAIECGQPPKAPS